VTGESNSRDSLISKVHRGEISSAAAEIEAKRLGLPPLARRPSSFDPMVEPWWTLPMAIAWIVWRQPRQVLLFWDEYRLRCWAWRTILGRHRLVQDSPATLGLLLRVERSGASAVKDDPKIKIVKNVMSVRSAKAELWRALGKGTLHATGVDLDAARRVPIRDFEWCDLECVEEHGRVIVRTRIASSRSVTSHTDRSNAARIVSQVMRGHDVNTKRAPAGHEYSEVRVKAEEVTIHWRSLEHASMDTAPVKNAVDDDAGNPGYIPLPQDEPTGPESKRAHQALLEKFPNRSVPKLSMQELADSLTPILRKIGKGGPVSRDAVRRALGLKK
jgi:hypothetical protein